MNSTTNYALPQWEGEDAVKRDDFNDAFATLDTTLKSVSDVAQAAAQSGFRYATGRYTGDGTYGSSSPNSLTFSSKPLFVLISGTSTVVMLYGASKAVTMSRLGNNQGECTLSWSGYRVSWYGDNAVHQANSASERYDYFALLAP